MRLIIYQSWKQPGIQRLSDYQLITKGLVNILNAFFAHSAHSAS